ncbi:MAG TPA: hypothetical protein VM925_19335 [Labilithrix sp.]|nr:hypothetical protein [Labilithrix sp.]
MKDIVIVALLIIAFAFVVTMHVVITFGLAKRKPRWRALVAFLFPPAAPFWGWKEHMRKRVGLWAVGVVVYVVMLVLSSRGT